MLVAPALHLLLNNVKVLSISSWFCFQIFLPMRVSFLFFFLKVISTNVSFFLTDQCGLCIVHVWRKEIILPYQWNICSYKLSTTELVDLCLNHFMHCIIFYCLVGYLLSCSYAQNWLIYFHRGKFMPIIVKKGLVVMYYDYSSMCDYLLLSYTWLYL